MTNDEICDKYLASLGYKRVKGHTLEPLLPALMLDICYQIYRREVQMYPCKNEAKRWKGVWRDAYNKFNKRVFLAFTPDESDELVDKMDAFETWIQNDIMIAKVQIMNILGDLSFEQQKFFSSLMIANVLAQSAQIVWGHCFKTQSGKNALNTDIEAIERATFKFMNHCHKEVSTKTVTPNESVAISNAVDALCNRMVRFLYKDKEPDFEPEMRIKTKK